MHPFQLLPLAVRKFLLIGALVGTVGMSALLSYLGAPLRTDASPQGIITFELAGSAERAREIVKAWRARPSSTPQQHGNRLEEMVVGQPRDLTDVAINNLSFDFLFLMCYALAFSLLCVAGAEALPPGGLRVTGFLLSFGAWGAALLDGLENSNLIRALLFAPTERLARTAALCAWAKFALILLCLLYLAAVAYRRNKRAASALALLAFLLVLAPLVRHVAGI